MSGSVDKEIVWYYAWGQMLDCNTFGNINRSVNSQVIFSQDEALVNWKQKLLETAGYLINCNKMSR